MLRSTSQAHWNDGNRVTPPKWLNFSGEFLQFSQILLAVTYLRTKFDEIWSKLLARVDCYVLSIDFDKLLYRECFFLPRHEEEILHGRHLQVCKKKVKLCRHRAPVPTWNWGIFEGFMHLSPLLAAVFIPIWDDGPQLQIFQVG